VSDNSAIPERRIACGKTSQPQTNWLLAPSFDIRSLCLRLQEYEIRVHKLLTPEIEWTVQHRYNDFAALHQALCVGGLPLPLPPKKVFGNTERQFLQERQTGLQNLLDEILKIQLLGTSLETRKFLDPHGYSENFYESALRNVSMFFRSEPNWQVVEPLRNIGWRFRKHYYLITNKTDSRGGKHILSWCEPGPDFSLSARELEAALKVLGDIRHPHIMPTVTASSNGVGVMTVRQFCVTGSLRDLIHGSRPQGHVIQKYSCPGRPLDVGTIKRYGRQVLDALSFLQDKGFVMGHVHAGNVLVDKSQHICKLVDVENSLLGVPTLYRAHLLEIRKIYTCEGETAYCFGHMLYEMATGRSLNAALMDEQCISVPPAVLPVLDSLLSAKGIKAGLPTITDLSSTPLFSDVAVSFIEKPSMKVPGKLKEVLRGHVEMAEMRLHDQQRRLAQQRRLSRAQDSVMSEDEKKKRKKKLKKQMRSVDEGGEAVVYPTTTVLPRSNTTIGATSVKAPKQKSTSEPNGPSSSTTATTTKQKSKSPSSAPPPQSQSAAPQPPPASTERGALLSSIHGFKKGKLKKAETSDRSAPKV
jgi:PX domain-containing protein kinase-like protein